MNHYLVTTIIHSWIILYLASSALAVPQINISLVSQGAPLQDEPVFYRNELLTFTCKAGGFSDITSLELFFVYYVVDFSKPIGERIGESGVGRSGCVKYAGIWRAKSNITSIPGVYGPHVTDSHCTTNARPQGFSVNVVLNLTDKTVQGNFLCRGYGASVREIFGSSYELKTLNDQPNYTMTVYPSDIIVEGVEFSFNCTNEDNNFKLQPEINGMKTTTYTPTKADRLKGVTLSCHDPDRYSSTKWKLIKVLKPRYAPDDLRLTVYPNTSVVEGEEFMFNCTSDNINATFEYYVKGEVVTLPKYTPEKVDRTGFNISCADVEFSDLDSGNDYITLMPIYVPGNLILTIYPNNTSVFEGEEFNFTCTSDDSLAQFDYKLNGKTVTPQSYTPTVSDRGGITIKCTDKAHSRIQGASIERVLMPVFSEDNARNVGCITKPLVVLNLIILSVCLVM